MSYESLTSKFICFIYGVKDQSSFYKSLGLFYESPSSFYISLPLKYLTLIADIKAQGLIVKVHHKVYLVNSYLFSLFLPIKSSFHVFGPQLILISPVSYISSESVLSSKSVLLIQPQSNRFLWSRCSSHYSRINFIICSSIPRPDPCSPLSGGVHRLPNVAPIWSSSYWQMTRKPKPKAVGGNKDCKGACL